MKALSITLGLMMAATAAVAEESVGQQDVDTAQKQPDMRSHQMNQAQMKQMRRGGLQRMQKNLDLTDEQVAQMQQIRKDGGSKEEMLEVLTDEQKAKRDQLHAQRRAKKEAAAQEAAQ